MQMVKTHSDYVLTYSQWSFSYDNVVFRQNDKKIQRHGFAELQ